jgi:AraC-like DNA-binding protein
MSRAGHDPPEASGVARSGPAAGPSAARTRLLDAPSVLVEDVRSRGRAPEGPSEGHSATYQIAFPYRGLLVWHVGRDDVVGDSNQVLFVAGGEDYRLSEPLPGGYAELIVTPDVETLAEIANTSESRLPAHPLFRRRSRRASPELQSLRARFLHWAAGGAGGAGGPGATGAPGGDTLAAEELTLALVRAALAEDAPRPEPGVGTRLLLRRAKEVLEAEFATPIRLHHVARTVGASPTYLTDLFRRLEGVSMHRYVAQLRLARALVELPHADDLSALALDVGFSSHSHFSAAFRRAFGCTPSQFREAARARRRPALP